MAKQQKRLISYAKVNARKGVSVPPYAIVSSEGFKSSYKSIKRIFNKSRSIEKVKVS